MRCENIKMKKVRFFQILSLLVRLQNSFQFNAFNFYNNIILLATTFFPLAQNASEPAFVVHY